MIINVILKNGMEPTIIADVDMEVFRDMLSDLKSDSELTIIGETGFLHVKYSEVAALVARAE